MKKLLIRGKTVTDFAEPTLGEILIEDNKLAAIDSGRRISEAIGKVDALEVVDFGENYILPAFIEVHAHGGGGLDFVDGTPEAFDSIFDTYLSHGVTKLCPTLCACDFADLLRFLDLCEVKKSHPGFAGVHLEGPFLSSEMCGAQNLSFLRDPSDADIEAVAAHSGVISRITAAPELSGASALAKRMLPLGVAMSVGHSAADAEIFKKARELGFSQVTHLYCSTRGRHKVGSYVRGGLLEAALADDDCYVELIGDGHHISRENLLLTMKCKGLDRVCIVSDGMRASGTVSPFESEDSPVRESYLGAISPENRVILKGGVAKLPDRSSFAGSLAVGDTMIRALCGSYRLPIGKISHMMSATPAEMLGLDRRGRLEVGYFADLTVLDPSFETLAVYRDGANVYCKE